MADILYRSSIDDQHLSTDLPDVPRPVSLLDVVS